MPRRAGIRRDRVNLPTSIEAMRLVEEGVATPEDVDKGVRLALGRRMGIFETGDLVRLDVTYGALKALYEETRDPRWYPPMILGPPKAFLSRRRVIRHASRPVVRHPLPPKFPTHRTPPGPGYPPKVHLGSPHRAAPTQQRNGRATRSRRTGQP